MNNFLLFNTAGFIIGVLVFAIVFPRQIKWEREVFLAFLVNIPNLFLLLMVFGPDYGLQLWALKFVVFAAVIFGGGGFGLGAIAGMTFVFVQTRGVRSS